MAKLKIYNFDLHGKTDFKSINIKDYNFNSKNSNEPVGSMRIYDDAYRYQYSNIHKLTCDVEFGFNQKDSIIFKDGMSTAKYKRKLIDDILLLISLLTGRNIIQRSRLKDTRHILRPSNYLETVSWDWTQLTNDVENAINIISDHAWQTKYKNGFHLRKLLNTANVNNIETRFLSYMTLWEWLFAHENNGGESNSLLEVIVFLLNKHFSSIINTSIYNSNNKSNNLIYLLRNQLTHNGMLPIDRAYASNDIKKISIEALYKYIDLIEDITQLLVLKTLKIDMEMRKIYNTISLDIYINEFLSTGRVLRFES